MRRRNAPILRGPDFAVQPAADPHETLPGVYVRRRVEGEWPTVDLDIDVDSMRWMRRARCRHHPEIEFFPGKGRPSGAARACCAECPVRVDCLAYALANGIEEGVWGGLYPKARRNAARWEPAGSFVYFAADDDLTFIKIGTSRQTNTRVAVQGLSLLAVEPGSYRREAELHNQFRRYRIGHTERFFPDDDLLAYIDSLLESHEENAA